MDCYFGADKIQPVVLTQGMKCTQCSPVFDPLTNCNRFNDIVAEGQRGEDNDPRETLEEVY